jgi:hypothetical protein
MNAMLDRLRSRLARGVLAVVFLAALPMIVTPAPAVEAAGSSPPPSPSASPTPAGREQQDRYRAYVSMLTVDGSGVMAAVIELRSCHDGRDACRQALSQARAEVKTFETDLDGSTPPDCLNGADDQIRTSLGLYDRGLELVQEGTDSQERLKVVQGSILVLVATQKLGAAIRAVRQSSC